MAIQPEVTAGGGSRQRLLVLALAGVVLVVLVALVARPLLSGGSAAAPAAAPPVTAAAPTTVTQLIRPSTSVAGPTAGTGKDPFRPAAGAVTTATTVTTAAPTTMTAAGAAGSGAGTVSASGATAQREVALEKVSSRSGKRYVKVSVDGSKYTAAQGDTFADDYLVVDVGDSCATFDSPSGRFTLCEGESVLK
jgi:hypothetical protein